MDSSQENKWDVPCLFIACMLVSCFLVPDWTLWMLCFSCRMVYLCGGSAWSVRSSFFWPSSSCWSSWSVVNERRMGLFSRLLQVSLWNQNFLQSYNFGHPLVCFQPWDIWSLVHTQEEEEKDPEHAGIHRQRRQPRIRWPAWRATDRCRGAHLWQCRWRSGAAQRTHESATALWSCWWVDLYTGSKNRKFDFFMSKAFCFSTWHPFSTLCCWTSSRPVVQWIFRASWTQLVACLFRICACVFLEMFSFAVLPTVFGKLTGSPDYPEKPPLPPAYSSRANTSMGFLVFTLKLIKLKIALAFL